MRTETILVLEDNALIRNRLCARFEAERYKVTVASNVADALQSVRIHMPDLVVLDVDLAEENSSAKPADGFAFLRALRRTHAALDPAVIIYSGYHSMEVEERAKSMDVFAVIAKKQGITALLTSIREALDERKTAQAATSA